MLKKIYFVFSFFIMSIFSFSLEINNGYIKDNYGNKVKLKEYTKIVSTDPASIEVLYEVGGEDKIIAIAKTSRSKIYPIEKTEKLNSIGEITNINFEKLLEYKPDLIIINAMMIKNLEKIKGMGFNVIVSEIKELNQVIDLIEIMGIISGKIEKAQELKEISIEKLKKIESSISIDKEIKGAIVYSTTPMMAFGDGSLPGNILKNLGVKNLASNVIGNRPILSPEYILKENPDFIAGAMSIESSNQILEASNVIPKTKAGKNNSIFILDSSIILRGSHRIFDEVLKLKEKLEKINNR